ncbi:MAG TPA: UDP-N-acetylmuramoyl-L-alanine--D-glutamate ligase [Candidatus Limnocylindria bacterium]|nr:UDP-N-acetylmuramoyl-L-alanine--D-glutamate ligase [Candidatus Limnocylindria bacterium]
MSLLFDTEVGREDFRGRRVTIVGLGKGRTTAGLAKFLVSCGARVTITDAKPRAELAEGLARLGDTDVELNLGPSSDDAALADPDFVFVIPGVRPRSATILRALQRRVPVLTEIGLFFRLCPAQIVGITGTKGKTTTTTMIQRILARQTRRVVVGGNIGLSVVQQLDTLKKDDIVVLELSSFQLETLALSPHVAVVTNISEDHLDHHGTRENYIAAKRNIVAWQGTHDVAVLNLDDAAVIAMHTGAASEVRGFSLTQRPRHGGFLDNEGRLVLTDGEHRTPLLAASEMRVPGRHNVADALAAAIVGNVFDVAPEAIATVLREFEGVPRRLETVRELDGVLWVNDSASTTPAATLSALAAYERKPVVILGGIAKGADYTALAREVVQRARGAVLIGAAAEEIAGALDAAMRAGGRPVPVERAKTLEEAVTAARVMARPGDVVLLSPAGAAREDLLDASQRSSDFFQSADDRGDRFAALVRSLEPARS